MRKPLTEKKRKMPRELEPITLFLSLKANLVFDRKKTRKDNRKKYNTDTLNLLRKKR